MCRGEHEVVRWPGRNVLGGLANARPQIAHIALTRRGYGLDPPMFNSAQWPYLPAVGVTENAGFTIW